jgi:hypothetical protein
MDCIDLPFQGHLLGVTDRSHGTAQLRLTASGNEAGILTAFYLLF